jgi:hypothetical protein
MMQRKLFERTQKNTQGLNSKSTSIPSTNASQQNDNNAQADASKIRRAPPGVNINAGLESELSRRGLSVTHLRK